MSAELCVIVHDDGEAFAAAVAKEIAAVMLEGRPVAVGLATGSTPILTYKHLVQLLKGKDLSHVHTFNLDEYEGLAPDHDQSYHYFMRHHLFDHISVPSSQIHFPSAGVDYDALIAKHGGLDLQLLGIGLNGHIGFNEPGSSLHSVTRRVELSDETRQSNARFFGGDKVPVLNCT
jgi:glucosamine-6-phosphate deaminase